MDRLRVLVAGLGSIGQRHVRNLRTLLGDGVEFVAFRRRGRSPVIGPDMTVREGGTVEEVYGIRSFADLDEALATRPDVALVTNPNVYHVPLALAAAQADCHLFIEKPVSHSLDGVDELIREVQSRGLVALVGYQFRLHPGLSLLKTYVDEGRLGRLVAAHLVNGEFLPDWHPYEDYRGTHPTRRDLGGGSLRTQIHELDLALWLFGMPERVFAVGGHLSGLDVDVEDSVSLLLECLTQGRSFPVHVHLDYLQRPPQRVCEIVGDAGRARYDYYASSVERWDAGTGEHVVQRFEGFDRNRMFLDEMEHLLACVRGDDKPVVDLREGLRSLRVALAAEASIRTGDAVEMADG